MSGPTPSPQPPVRSLLDRVGSIKLKLGLVVAGSVLVATVLGTVSDRAGVPAWLAIPVTVLLALAVTQLLATGMTSPLRQMTDAAARMARGDYAVDLRTDAADEVGELARAFTAMATELAEVDQRRRELVATVAHELRTPLTGLVGTLENIADGVRPADPDGVRVALAQAERLHVLVRDLLDLSRVDGGAVPLQLQDTPLAPLLEEVVAQSPRHREVTVQVAVEPPDLTVRIDPSRVHQLVANLLDNATRHSPAGAAVHVSATSYDDDWVLSVDNDGRLVAAADRERAFERYGRLDDSDGGGTGLGLAIARWVAQLHGGRVGFVDPPSGTGARVEARLSRHPRPPGRPTSTSTPTEGPAMPTPPAAAPIAPPLAPPVTAPSPPSMVSWPVDQPPGRPRLLLAAAVVGLLAALLVATHVPGLGYVAVLLAGGAVVWSATGWRRDRFTVACGILAVALTSVLMWRDALWVGVLCLLAASALCLAGAVRPRTIEGMVLSGVLWAIAGLHGLPWLGRTLQALTKDGRRGRAHLPSLVRTALFSLAGVVVFGLLFASADALFASWVDAVLPDIGDPTVAFRIFVGVAVAALVLATSYVALHPPRVEWDPPRAPRPVARRYEWLVPVLLVDAVVAVFLLAQAAAVFGGHGYVQRTTGLTYADYVHQGFGQLTVATALTLAVVAAAARKAPRATPADRAWLRGALGTLCGLTLVVVASALHRMDLYQDAYGFTRLRLVVDTFEIWLGVVVLAVLVAGVRLAGSWLPRFGLLSGATALLLLALSNPDARIAEGNLDRYAETGRLDTYYLSYLSSDAVPALAAHRDERVDCPLAELRPDPLPWTDWNLGRARASSTLGSLKDLPGPTCVGKLRGY